MQIRNQTEESRPDCNNDDKKKLQLVKRLKAKLAKIEQKLDMCRTSALHDGWQTSRHAKKSRKWDFYAQEKMKIIMLLDDLGAR